MLKDFIFSLFQFFSIPIIVILNIAYNVRVEKPAGLKVPSGTLIISNHQSIFDPWLVGFNMGLWNLLMMLPVRFPITPRFYRIFGLGTLLWCFGGYDIGSTMLERAKKLLYTRDLVHKGYTVMLFPEGKVHREQLGEFKQGMNALINEDVPLLFARIEGMNTKKLFGNVSIKYSDLLLNQSVEEKLNKALQFFGLNEW